MEKISKAKFAEIKKLYKTEINNYLKDGNYHLLTPDQLEQIEYNQTNKEYSVTYLAEEFARQTVDIIDALVEAKII